MINLIPDKTFNREEFWSLIKKNNEWLIRLRFYAVGMLLASLPGAMIFLHLSRIQIFSILIICVTILSYNVLIKKIVSNYDSAEGNINSIHISLLQIILDLFQLSILIYLTGGVESPIFVFLVFHIIIGSILLPVSIVLVIAFFVSAGFTALIFLEYFGYIPHQQLVGLYGVSVYDKIEYIIIYLIVFNLFVFVSIYLTHKIASQLFQRESDLKDALEKIKEAEKAKQKYVVGVVHELKTPIVAIQSMLDLVLMKYVGPVSSEVEEKLIRARVRSVESIRIINDILKISKLKLLDKVNKDPVDTAAILNSIIEGLTPTCEVKKIQISFIDKRNKQLTVEGDKHLLELAFSNLMGNAVKYTPEGGKIEVLLDETDKNQVIEISDTGIGIPEQDVASIFNEFYRASNLKKVNIEGTGMGLSVVKTIINQHNGHIYAESPSKLADGTHKGAGFKVLLPLSL